MLGSLAGVITAHLDQRILVEVNGVGYWVHTGSWQPSGEVTCYLHHHIREDASDLYGFPTVTALVLFEHLLGVNGVGPKVALAILSIGSIERIAQAIHNNDTTFLTLAPGVGAKAAQKIVLELKTKALPGSGEAAPESSVMHDDVMAALESLGYRPADLRPVLAKLPAGLDTLNDQIKWVLQQLQPKSKR